MKENWEEIATAFEARLEDEKEIFISHFNGVAEEVGDHLFGDDVNDFLSKVEGLNDEEQKAFVE